MAATARISIALPVELKREMDAVPNVARPNWSALVRPRNEAEIVKLKRERGDQTAAIARLRASKLEQDRENMIQGWKDGSEWAEERAEYLALKRLEKSVRNLPNLWDRPWQRLREANDPQSNYSDERLCRHLFEDPLCECLDYPSYLTAFIEGALAAWVAIADDVEADDPEATDYLPQLGPYVASESNVTTDFEAMAAALAEQVTAAIGR